MDEVPAVGLHVVGPRLQRQRLVEGRGSRCRSRSRSHQQEDLCDFGSQTGQPGAGDGRAGVSVPRSCRRKPRCRRGALFRSPPKRTTFLLTDRRRATSWRGRRTDGAKVPGVFPERVGPGAGSPRSYSRALPKRTRGFVGLVVADRAPESATSTPFASPGFEVVPLRVAGS